MADPRRGQLLEPRPVREAIFGRSPVPLREDDPRALMLGFDLLETFGHDGAMRNGKQVITARRRPRD